MPVPNFPPMPPGEEQQHTRNNFTEISKFMLDSVMYGQDFHFFTRARTAYGINAAIQRATRAARIDGSIYIIPTILGNPDTYLTIQTRSIFHPDYTSSVAFTCCIVKRVSAGKFSVQPVFFNASFSGTFLREFHRNYSPDTSLDQWFARVLNVVFVYPTVFTSDIFKKFCPQFLLPFVLE